jgi:hypothetical protein
MNFRQFNDAVNSKFTDLILNFKMYYKTIMHAVTLTDPYSTKLSFCSWLLIAGPLKILCLMVLLVKNEVNILDFSFY